MMNTLYIMKYSSIFKRNDDKSLNIKGKKVNELLEEKLSIRGIYRKFQRHLLKTMAISLLLM